MKNFHDTVDEIYEFLDEILGSMIPGMYFCIYFVWTIWVFISFCNKESPEINEKMFFLVFLVFSYILGTMFRRSNSREPDHYSAKFIYFNSIPHDDNDFAFIKLIQDSEYKSFTYDIITLKDNKKIKISFNNNKLTNRKRKYKFYERIFYSSYKKRNHNNRLYSKSEMLTYIYNKLLRRQALLNRLQKFGFFGKNINEELKEIGLFIKKHQLEYYCNIYVDYPYDNLKNYLNERGMSDLTKYIEWDIDDSNSKTNRTKSIICNMKNYIRHTSPSDYSNLQKIEAHIRFMNSIWYANKLLSKIAEMFFCFFSFSAIIIFIITDRLLLKYIYDNFSQLNITKIIKDLVDWGKQLFLILFGQDIEYENVIKSLICTALISLLYCFCGKIIKRSLQNNFHYQRIREAVSVIYVYDMLLKQNKGL